MNESKTLFISGETPFVPGDRDITVPVTRCNGLCHVTRTLSRHRDSHMREKIFFTHSDPHGAAPSRGRFLTGMPDDDLLQRPIVA
jgi:hypothetical protein